MGYLYLRIVERTFESGGILTRVTSLPAKVKTIQIVLISWFESRILTTRHLWDAVKILTECKLGS